MTNKILHKRGLEINLPLLDPSEIGYTTDTEKIFIGGELANIELAKKSYTDEQIAAAKGYTDEVAEEVKTELRQTIQESVPLATSLKNGLMAKEDKAAIDDIKLNGLASTVLLQDTTHRTVTDAQIAEWDAKETPLGAQAKADGAVTTAKAYTDQVIVDLIGEAPDTLDTIYELAQALLDLDAKVLENLGTMLAGKADKAHVHEAIDINETVGKQFISQTEKETIQTNTRSIANILETLQTSQTATIDGGTF